MEYDKAEQKFTNMSKMVTYRSVKPTSILKRELKARKIGIFTFLFTREISISEWIKIRFFGYPMTELFCRRIQLHGIPYFFWLNCQNHHDKNEYCLENDYKNFDEIDL